MTYSLGVDLGTTFTAAAICRPGERPEMVSLGASGYAIPSVLFLRRDNTFLVGEPAEFNSASEPTRLARYFKRQLGEGGPRIIGGTPFSAEQLTTELLTWVLNTVTARVGYPPTNVVLTHPAIWGEYRLERLRAVAIASGITSVIMCPEPVAAAINYATSERVEVGELIGVYDLGGGTFDAVVMRRTEMGFEIVGAPRGVERLGGLDFDDVIWEFATTESDVDVATLASSADEATISAGFNLRRSCTEAKKVLSADTHADIRVLLPNIANTVRLTRDQFERQIRPRLSETIVAFRAALSSGEVNSADLSRILLVGGSSRIPLVSQLLSQAFGRPLAVDTDPKNTVALGAAYRGTLPDPEPATNPEPVIQVDHERTTEESPPSVPPSDPPPRPTTQRVAPTPPVAPGRLGNPPARLTPSPPGPAPTSHPTHSGQPSGIEVPPPLTEPAPTAPTTPPPSQAPEPPPSAPDQGPKTIGLDGVRSASSHRPRFTPRPATEPIEIPDALTSTGVTEVERSNVSLYIAAAAAVLTAVAVGLWVAGVFG